MMTMLTYSIIAVTELQRRKSTTLLTSLCQYLLSDMTCIFNHKTQDTYFNNTCLTHNFDDLKMTTKYVHRMLNALQCNTK